MKKAITAALLSAGLMLPASSAFAYHHYSRTRGTLIGAAAGALVAHDHVKGAVIGAAVGNGVQYARTKHAQSVSQSRYARRHNHSRRY